MSNVPTNAHAMRNLLVTYLDHAKNYMVADKDRTWIQGEMDRYNDQIIYLKQGQQKADMVPTGIVRCVDEIGRYVVPKELRTTLDIEPGTLMEIFMDEKRGMIVLQKYEPGCSFCGSIPPIGEMTLFQGKRVCENCLHEMFTMGGIIE